MKNKNIIVKNYEQNDRARDVKIDERRSVDVGTIKTDDLRSSVLQNETC